MVGFKISLDFKQSFKTVMQKDTVFNAGLYCSLLANPPSLSVAELVQQNMLCVYSSFKYLYKTKQILWLRSIFSV